MLNNIGPTGLLLVAIVVLVLFGRGKVSGLMGEVGKGITVEEARAQRHATIPAGRYGTPAEFGAACAFLCSAHAGFIVGQNWVLDGGSANITI